MCTYRKVRVFAHFWHFFQNSSSPRLSLKKYTKYCFYINIPELHFFRFYITVRLSLFAFRSLNGKLVVSILCLFWSWRLLYLLLTPMLVSYYQNHNIFIQWGRQIEWCVPWSYFSVRFSVGFCVKFRVEFHVGFCVGSFSSNHWS